MKTRQTEPGAMANGVCQRRARFRLWLSIANRGVDTLRLPY